MIVVAGEHGNDVIIRDMGGMSDEIGVALIARNGYGTSGSPSRHLRFSHPRVPLVGQPGEQMMVAPDSVP